MEAISLGYCCDCDEEIIKCDGCALTVCCCEDGDNCLCQKDKDVT